MQFSARQLAETVNGQLEGNPDVLINGISKLDDSKPGTFSFLSNPAYTPHIYTTQAAIVLVSHDFKPERALPGCTLIRVENPYAAFAQLMAMYENLRQPKFEIHPQAVIDETALLASEIYIGPHVCIGKHVKIGKGCKIYAHTVIGDHVTIGDYTTLYSNVSIYHDCSIGAHCIIHANTVIGSDGFGFAPNAGDTFVKVPQLGNVKIDDHVEIGSNTSVDRATLGSTWIQSGVKIDNLVQIAHNVVIGENTVIAALSGIAGSTKIGKHCMIGAQVGIAGHITIADGVKIAGQSGIASSITETGLTVQGSPALKINAFRRSYVLFKNLPSLQERIQNLEQSAKPPGL
ncbi:MAG: UDP-3-O-(3-hydroxymyristoyl)glucosamine N-acyltransferase [Bacteroidia bacterium]|jgi:UDP-3-O-[3-hydroxymyristoyl] glucosamine N-acyltransferase